MTGDKAYRQDPRRRTGGGGLMAPQRKRNPNGAGTVHSHSACGAGPQEAVRQTRRTR